VTRNCAPAFCLSLAAFTLAGCGGGGQQQTLYQTIEIPAQVDGMVDAGEATLGTSVIQVGKYLVGGEPVGLQRGIFRFNLSVLAGKNIASATLRLTQLSVTGQPYVNLGAMLVEWIDCGSTIDSQDFDSPAQAGDTRMQAENGPGNLQDVGTAFGPTGRADLTSLVVTNLELQRQLGGAFFDVRVRLQGDEGTNGGEDSVGIQASEAGPGASAPVLIVVAYDP
jgi:hypothetical protein